MPKYAMNDGRQFTDYRSACILNEELKKKYNLSQDNPHFYKSFLEHNAEMLIREMRERAERQSDSLIHEPLNNKL